MFKGFCVSPKIMICRTWVLLDANRSPKVQYTDVRLSSNNLHYFIISQDLEKSHEHYECSTQRDTTPCFQIHFHQGTLLHWAWRLSQRKKRSVTIVTMRKILRKRFMDFTEPRDSKCLLHDNVTGALEENEGGRGLGCWQGSPQGEGTEQAETRGMREKPCWQVR